MTFSVCYAGREGGGVYVRLAGGQVGRYATRVLGVPTVSARDRLVWFLAPHPRGGYSVLGLHQGALRTMQAAGGEMLVAAPPRVPSARGAVSRLPRRLSDLASEVRTLLASGDER